MKLLGIVTFIWFELCLGTDIPDLTAFYHVGKNSSVNYVDIHLRTDALGFPVAVKDQIIGSEDLEFYLDSHNLNEWEHGDWSLVTTNSSLNSPNVPIFGEVSEFHPFYGGVQINEIDESCRQFRLILSTDRTPLDSQAEFIWFFEYTRVLKCSAQTSSGYSRDYSYSILDRTVWCTTLKDFNLYSCTRHSLRITQENGTLKFWYPFYSQTYSWNLKYRIKFYKTYFIEHSRNHIRGNVNPLVHFLETNGKAKLISPTFTRSYKNLCLTVIFYTGQNTVLKSMDVYAQDMLLNRVFLGSFDNNLDEAPHLHARKLITHWPKGIDSAKVRLLIEISVETGTLRLERITSCNAEYGEDVVVVKNKETVNFSSIRMPIISNNDDDYIPVTPGQCQHSSVYVVNRCACPPGFVGSTCNKGCGENRFGKDCKGKCSVHPSGCSGFLMCTLVAGCFCAPGYEGSTCEKQCSNGTYGNNCIHRCGHCKEETCNIYTGECSACQPGYQLPHCQKKYDYTLYAPKIMNSATFGEAIVTPVFISTTSNANPLFYTIQYKRQLTSEPWISYSTHSIPRDSPTDPTTIKGLEHGVPYMVRIVLIDADLNSYEGDDIPAYNFISSCIIPENPEYHVDAVTNQTFITVSWKYTLETYWCPVEKFEISWTGGWNWMTDFTDKKTYTISNLLPDTSIKFKVRAVTKSGSAAFSSVTGFTTKSSTITEQVQGLEVVTTTSNSAKIIWSPPFGLETTPLAYIVSYKCLKRVACHKQCGNSSGFLHVTSPNVSLDFLYPMTQYSVSVSAEDGPLRNIVFGTKMTVPSEVPEPSSKPPIRTNTSVTVFWNATEVCSGFFNGYVYQLYKVDDPQQIQMGSTQNTSATFGNLKVSTEYRVLVYIQTSFGDISSDKFLDIYVSTSATVPDPIQNLTVYKKGRHLLGLRWASPINSYGAIVSYTIKYGYGENTTYKTEMVKPSPCVVWPHLFCHTVTQLQPDRRYIIIVTARNSEVDADGMPSEVHGITKEKTPGPPENVKLLNSTSTTFAIQWDYPWLANGIIRTFLLSIEETEQFEEEKCCEIYPLFETTVTEELEHYVTEMSGLHAASTYIVSVSAKTVVFGPSQAITVHTRPPPLPIEQLPNVIVQTENDLIWWPQQSNFANNSDDYKPLVKGSLILVVSNHTAFDNTGVQNQQLNEELKTVIPGNFYITAEYTGQEDEIKLGTDETIDSIWGEIHNTALQPLLTYQLAVIQITEYCGVYNFDIVWSAPFTAS